MYLPVSAPFHVGRRQSASNKACLPDEALLPGDSELAFWSLHGHGEKQVPLSFRPALRHHVLRRPALQLGETIRRPRTSRGDGWVIVLA